jgi:hypothetical protein
VVRNIKSNENEEGNESVIPLTLIIDWFVCIYIAARAGPMYLTTILNILLIPNVTPKHSRGEDSIITFIAPTAARDNPADNMPKPVEINNSDEWNSKIISKPNVVKAEPKITGLIDPNLDIMIPDVGSEYQKNYCKRQLNLSSVYCIFSKTNRYWTLYENRNCLKNQNIDIPTIIITTLENNIGGLRIILKSISGNFVCFSM